ncbi:uncharacterized protein LOC116346184 [Contarinia nasturtii]|uniref:uncharacterized protein LOC116346184 n=1 Tax=Contarinia nasturtii TaxID=265458 RepID=UPI0012D3A844|nr:uncharacterized protein LOC116346184 [Contarinia nasturtii]
MLPVMKRERDEEPSEGTSSKRSKKENTPSQLTIDKPKTEKIVSASELNTMIMTQRQQNGPLQLVHIIQECLTVIFQYLDLKDLYNVAEADKHFVPVVRSIFSQRYRHKQLVLNLSDISANVSSDCIEIPKELNTTAFFEYFGSAILKLKVIGMDWCPNEIKESFLKHCTASIVELELVSCTYCFKGVDQPFENVKHLVINDSTLWSLWPDQWFPNVIELHLKFKSIHANFLPGHFPKMTRLDIDDPNMKILPRIVDRMIRMNPQLTCLGVQRDYDIEFLRVASESLPHLKHLELFVPKDGFRSSGDQKIHFENVKTFALAKLHDADGAAVVNMPFLFTKLEELFFFGGTGFNDEVLNFIKENKTVKELNMMAFDLNSMTYNDLVLIIRSMPNLSALMIDAVTFTTKELIQLLCDGDEWNISKLFFAFDFDSKRRKFQSKAYKSKIENKWTIVAVRYSNSPIFGLEFNKL